MGTHHRASSRGQKIHTTLAIAGASALILGCAAVIVALTSGGSPNRPAPKPAAAASDVTSPTAPGESAAPPSSSSPTALTLPTEAPAGPLTYTVKPGDNLTIIAAWFHLHGYGQLYDANKSVIGDNPSLIHPGLVITVSSQGLTVQ